MRKGYAIFLFSGRPLADYCLGFRESGHARRDTVELGHTSRDMRDGIARRDTVERSGRIFTRRTTASAPHNASVIGDLAEN